MKNKYTSYDAMNIMTLFAVGIIPAFLWPINGNLSPSKSKLFLLGILTILYLYFLLSRKVDFSIYKEKESKRLLLYFAYMIIATIFAVNPIIAIMGSIHRFDGLLTFITYISVFFIAKSSKKIPYLMEVISISGFFIALLGVFQFYGIDLIPQNLYPIYWEKIAFGTMGNPNFLGSYLVLAIIAPLYLYFRKDKKIGLLIYGVMEIALLATRTRGAWIGAFIGILSYLIMHLQDKKKNFAINKKDMKKLISFLLLTIIIFLIYLLTAKEDFINRLLLLFGDFKMVWLQTDDSYKAGSARIYVWRKSVELIKMKPIFGYGVENMSIAMKMNFKGEIIDIFGRFRNWDKAHNEFLNIAISTGVPSLIIYISFLWSVIKKGFKNINKSPLYIPLLASIIGYLVQAQFNIQVVMVYYIFFAFLGIISSKDGLKETI